MGWLALALALALAGMTRAKIRVWEGPRDKDLRCDLDVYSGFLQLLQGP